jgi:hypothetical protein
MAIDYKAPECRLMEWSGRAPLAPEGGGDRRSDRGCGVVRVGMSQGQAKVRSLQGVSRQ